MSFLKRAVQVSEGKPAKQAVVDMKFGKEYPALFEYLSSGSYPDGTERRTASLSIFTEDGQFKACLNDRDQGLVLFAAGKTFQGSLVALEALLTSDETPWRASREQRAPARQGKGKGI